jgi:hypothetical protein
MARLNAAELTTFYAEYVDRWNRRDLEDYYSLYAEDLVLRDGSVVLHGVGALRERYEAELRDHPDLVMECARLFVDAESQSIAAENIERGIGHRGSRSRIFGLLKTHNRKRPRGERRRILGLLQGGEIFISIYVDPWEVGGPFDVSRCDHRGKR